MVLDKAATDALKGFTPGPWLIEAHGNGEALYSGRDNGHHGYNLCYLTYPDGNWEKNRALIEASPDLLDTIAALRNEVAKLDAEARGDDHPTGVVHKSYHKAVIAALRAENGRLRGLIKAWADAVNNPSKGAVGGYFDPTKRPPLFAAGGALLAEAKRDGGEAHD